MGAFLRLIGDIGRLVLEAAPRRERSSRRRDLKRELRDQATPDYWRRREEARSRRFRIVKLRHGFRLRSRSLRDRAVAVRADATGMLPAFGGGALAFGTAWAIEWALARHAEPRLVPAGEAPLSVVPVIAVPVAATLLGIYFASVGIVLSTSYQRVSARVRSLVLGDARRRGRLQTIVFAIGWGIALVLLPGFGIPYGYAVASLYVVLVALSAYYLIRLNTDAFALFDPAALSVEPLSAIARSIDRMGSAGDDAVLDAAAREADSNLGTLTELIALRSVRSPARQDSLADMAEYLIMLVRRYSRKKHLLTPDSGWFMRRPVYQRWVEADPSLVEIALRTAVPLPAQLQPVPDWLEDRSAHVAAAAIEACVSSDDRNSALRIMNALRITVQALAETGHTDDALAVAGIVRDRCGSIQPGKTAAAPVVSEIPTVFASLFLGWIEAASSWPDEVRSVVASTEWGPDTEAVRIRGPRRVRDAAQRLLREIQSEIAVDGKRTTPDWYLRHALATEYVIALREFARLLPDLLDEYLGGAFRPPGEPMSNVVIGGQALQALAKSELLVAAIPGAICALEALRPPNEPMPTAELDGIGNRIRGSRSQILKHMADAIIALQPKAEPSAPDFFGGAWFTLVHHMERALREREDAVVRDVFPKLLLATYNFQGHMVTTYQPPYHQAAGTWAATVDKMVEVIELSGLALIYDELHGGMLAEPIREAWTSLDAGFVKYALDQLDYHTLALSSSMRISKWRISLAEAIVAAGYARPQYGSFDPSPHQDAPRLIGMLNADEAHDLGIAPGAVFAGEVLGPLSEEGDENLAERPGLRRYYEVRPK